MCVCIYICICIYTRTTEFLLALPVSKKGGKYVKKIDQKRLTYLKVLESFSFLLGEEKTF